MSRVRVSSSPDLLPLSNSTSPDDLSLEGIATNVKLLLKLVQDHQIATQKGNMDDRKVQRLAGMMTILDDIKTRIQRSQSSNKKKAELRRCNTDLRSNIPPTDPQKKNEPLSLDEKEKLKRDLTASYAAQKRLGVMCASLGREKDIISRELTRKVQELNEMEEHLADLRGQNQKLSSKIQASVADGTQGNVSETVNIENAGMQERNKELLDQLVRSYEGYKAMKRRMKEGHDDVEGMLATMNDIVEEIELGICQTQSLKQHIDARGLGEKMGDIEEIAALEDVFRRLKRRVSTYTKEG